MSYRVGHLWIKECGEKKCKMRDKGWHYHRPNPRGQAVKVLEMTVRRALQIYKVFDELPPEAKDWTDAEPKDLRKALGDDAFDPTLAIWPTLWERYKKGTLQREIEEMVENLNMEDLSKASRKEIKDGLSRFSEE